MKKLSYSNIYFVGIGGIGMSALARYFKVQGVHVSGYDKVESNLTKQLTQEGIEVHYEDLGENVNQAVGTPDSTLVIITPAVPKDLGELIYFKSKGFTINKRAEVLGLITEHWKTLAVAGTHGKTTTSTMLAYVLSLLPEKCNAFLGGISSNFNSNLIIEPQSQWMVVEADEYDRSFHQLHPFSAIITSTDADHLDIYKSKEEMVKAFEEFGNLVSSNGTLIVHHSVDVCQNSQRLSYGINEEISVDYIGKNVRVENGHFVMDVQTPTQLYSNVKLGLPGTHNAENALAVIAMCESIGIQFEEIRNALHSFKGVKRRFELIAKTDKVIYIDDYAHHPTAIQRLLESVKLIYKNMPIYIIFQPHLYSRTKDFMNAFAKELSKADTVILMPIYPAREKPMEGITSETLAGLIQTEVSVLNSEEVLAFIPTIKEGVILTVGAGDIDRIVEPISEILR